MALRTPHSRRRPATLVLQVALLFCLGVGLGCAPLLGPAMQLEYFHQPDALDPWSPKIAGWQQRELADVGPDAPAVPAVAEGAPALEDAAANEVALRSKYFGFRAGQRRALAREFATWIQSQAKAHYVADGPIDHWATLEETLRGNGDDCDGLELLVYHGLRDLGFAENEVYRAVVYRPDDGQHHMVTLWFEDSEDPWVIDPTGAMSSGMHRMSQIPEWTPLKVFSADEEFTVRRTPRPEPDSPSALAANR